MVCRSKNPVEHAESDFCRAACCPNLSTVQQDRVDRTHEQSVPAGKWATSIGSVSNLFAENHLAVNHYSKILCVGLVSRSPTRDDRPDVLLSKHLISVVMSAVKGHGLIRNVISEAKEARFHVSPQQAMTHSKDRVPRSITNQLRM